MDELACNDIQAKLYSYIMDKLIHCDTHALMLYFGFTGL